MKKLLIPMVILICAMLLVGCGSPSTPTASAPTTQPATSQPATTKPAVTTTAAASTTQPTTAITPVSKPATTATSASAKGPKSGGVFKFMDPRAPSTTLGWFGEAGSQGGMWTPPVLETLIEAGVDGSYTPKLAEKWEVAPDLKSITFYLRKGVKFQDGSDFNAAVAMWNIQNLITAKVSSTYLAISSMDKIDDYTFRLNLSRYQNPMMGTLGQAYMTSKAAFDAKGGKEGVRWNPVGTGAFNFVSFERDVSAKFTKSKTYWQQDRPYLNAVEMYFVAENLTMNAAFQAGEFDAMGGDLGSIHYDLQQKGYPIVSQLSGAYTLVGDSKNADSPWSKIKVRQALDYAIDRESLAKVRGFGFWQPIYQFAVPGTPTYITNLQNRSYNVAKAKQLLAEAGYPNGFKTKIYADSASSDRDAITAVQAYLANVGINAELSILDFGSYGNYRNNGWNNALLAGMIGWSPRINIDSYFSQTATMYPSMEKTNDMQALQNAAITAKDYDPALTQKVIQYLYDNALISPLWAGARGDVIKPYVKDTGMYTFSSWVGWKPYETWLDK